MSIALNIINTGSSGPRGWHSHELMARCAQQYAWAKFGSGARFEQMKLTEQAKAGAPPPNAPLLRGSLLHIHHAHLYEHVRRAQDGASWGDLVNVPDGAGGKFNTPAARFSALLAPSDAMESVMAEYEAAWPGCTDDFRLKLRRACAAYGKFWEQIDRRFVILGVEVLCETPVTWRDTVVHFTQRIDAVVLEIATGLIHYWDHKSTARIDAKVHARYTLSGQSLAMQHLGLRRHGREFGGFYINLIGLNPVSFDRERVAPAPYALSRWPRDLVFQANQMKRLEVEYGTDPHEWPASPTEMTCMTAYGPCEYFDMCRWGKALTHEADPSDVEIHAMVAAASGAAHVIITPDVEV